jgi:hypothetical protein
VQSIAKISGSAIEDLNLEYIRKLIEKRYKNAGVFVVSVPSAIKKDIKRSIETALQDDQKARDQFKKIYERFNKRFL